ncbi:hypothetical protein Acr_01g0009480 [Actinidia rufa]|uniref:Uncharacterized protein n=1 Tax=Actinidia rufa TaxID=165716 RepID=A0A7J0E5B8_9ERIC|nr:hypothetical protein Acr_01g0009480 [Actinidia rufa]
MLQSILEVEDGLRLLVASPEWRGLDYNRKELAKSVTNIIQNNTEFWNQGKEVLEVLEPLVQVLRLVDGDGSTSGYLYEAMERAKEAIKQRVVETIQLNTAMTMLKTSHPRVWWDYCGDCLPVLQNAWEAAQTKKRNKLAPKMLDDLVYVRMNTMMMEKFNELEAQDLESINLEKLSELPEYVDHENDEVDNPSDRTNENVEDSLIAHDDLSWLD